MTILFALPMFAVFLVVTALLGGVVEDERWRIFAGFVAGIGVPTAVYLRFQTRASWAMFVGGFDAVVACVLAFGFADDVGRALRRHGDWFVGDRNGWVSRQLRSGIGELAMRLERFDPPAEIAPVVLPPDQQPLGPWRPGETPPTTVAWFHPLAGPRRAMPLREARRFGAARPQPRPSECELGHCGVDLGSTIGEPVFAVSDGIVERIERNEGAGGRAGRYVRIAHVAREGGRTPVTRYVHLDSVRVDLKEGDKVQGGELIGRLGSTGIEHSAPHLHFGLSLRSGAHGSTERYIDPEPLLHQWALREAETLPTTALAGKATASVM